MTDKTPEQEAYLAGVAAAAHQITELNAECDQWQKKVADLWAERERINAEWREQIQAEHVAYQELRAENKRLRAALHEVVAAGHDPYCKVSVGRCSLPPLGRRRSAW